MRKLGLDLGAKRIGIAISDVMGILSSPMETYISRGTRRDADYIAELVANRQVDTVIIGLPLNLDGTEGKRAKEARFFGSVLGKIVSVPILFVDERLTTVEAEQLLEEAKVKKAKRKKVIDQVSAQLILDTYLKSIINQ